MLLLLLLASSVALTAPIARSAEPSEKPEQAKHADYYARYSKAIEANDLEGAVVYARRALRASERERGPADPQTGVLAYNLGVVNFELGRYRDAAAALRQALPIYEAVHGVDSEKYTKPLIKLAASHQQLEEWASAERLYVQASDILIALRGRDDETVGLILGQLTQVASGLDDPTRVRSYGLRSLAILSRVEEPDPIAVANLHIAIAGAEMQLGEPRKGRKHTERAVELYEGEFEENDPRMLGVYEFASRIYDQTGREATARKYRRRIKDAGGGGD